MYNEISWPYNIPQSVMITMQLFLQSNSVLAFFQINLVQCQRDLKVNVNYLMYNYYLMCIWLIIEYAVVIWSPHTQHNICSVEMIQQMQPDLFLMILQDSQHHHYVRTSRMEFISKVTRSVTFYKINNSFVEIPHSYPYLCWISYHCYEYHQL